MEIYLGSLAQPYLRATTRTWTLALSMRKNLAETARQACPEDHKDRIEQHCLQNMSKTYDGSDEEGGLVLKVGPNSQ